MLLLKQVENSPVAALDGFQDHLVPKMLYYLPERLALNRNASGAPDFFVLRYAGDDSDVSGGLLHMTLGLVGPAPEDMETAAEAGWQIRPVPFDAGYLRLRLRSLVEGEDDQVGQWVPATLEGSTLQTTRVSLTPLETQMLMPLLEEGQSAVELELRLAYRGLAPGISWLATVQTEELKTQLAALLDEEESVRLDEVVAAFHSLPEPRDGFLTLRSLEPEAEEISEPEILNEVAARSLGTLFEAASGNGVLEPTRYHLVPHSEDDPRTHSWDLLPFRQERRVHSLAWSVSGIHEELGDPAERSHFFPVVTRLSPFEATQVFVLNHLPFDPEYLREVRVELRFNGPSGVPARRSFRFTGDTYVESFTTVHPATTEFDLQYRITSRLAPPGGTGWPAFVRADFRPADGPVIDVNREAAGIEFVRVEAELPVFDAARSIEVDLLSVPTVDSSEDPDAQPGEVEPELLARTSLTSDRLNAWIALPGLGPEVPLDVRCRAYPAAGEDQTPYTLIDGSLAERRLKIAAYQLAVLDPDLITITLDAETASSFPFVAVALKPIDAQETDEGKLYTLEPGESRVWALFRGSVFETVHYRYRIHYVALDEDGNTLPMALTEWTEAEDTTLVVVPPGIDSEVPQ